ncbi:MAG: D-alanine--D-alanine ligase [bacterium]|nr:D-alanine--D-alanine ligase [bacterium]
MSFSKKIRVAVLRGGPSSEYEVSLKTGEEVLRHLPSDRYQGVDVFIDKSGVWHVHGIERKPADALNHVDVAFVALHGQFGEDGKIQRILEHLGIPYTGSQAFPSAIAMNKHLTKGALTRLKDKVKLAFHKIYNKEEVENKGAHVIFREVMMPAIVKPNASGSSHGVSLVRTYPELEAALSKALEHSDSVMVEELIEGREATCGVVEGFRGQSHYTLLPVEIIPHESADFFDYSAKYGGGTQEICPGNFTDETKRKIQEAAEAVHKELGLRHYSRSDFMVHPRRGVYFLEVNTLPGLTSESLLPKSVRAVGSTFPEFLDHVIQLSLKQR